MIKEIASALEISMCIVNSISPAAPLEMMTFFRVRGIANRDKGFCFVQNAHFADCPPANIGRNHRYYVNHVWGFLVDLYAVYFSAPLFAFNASW